MTFLYVSGFLGSFFKWLSLPVFFKRIFYQVTLNDSRKLSQQKVNFTAALTHAQLLHRSYRRIKV